MSEPLEPKVYVLQDVLERAAVSTTEAEADFPGMRSFILVVDPIGDYRYRAGNFDTSELIGTLLRAVEVLHRTLVQRLTALPEPVSADDRHLAEVDTKVDAERVGHIEDAGFQDPGVGEAELKIH